MSILVRKMRGFDSQRPAPTKPDVTLFRKFTLVVQLNEITIFLSDVDKISTTATSTLFYCSLAGPLRSNSTKGMFFNDNGAEFF